MCQTLPTWLSGIFRGAFSNPTRSCQRPAWRGSFRFRRSCGACSSPDAGSVEQTSATRQESSTRGGPLRGMVELPGIFGRGNPSGPPGQTMTGPVTPVPAFDAPSFGANVIAVLTTAEQMEVGEHAYEEVSALVYDVREGWFEIALKSASRATAWVSPDDAGPFRTVASLVSAGGYTTVGWDRRLRTVPEWSNEGTNVPGTKDDTVDARLIGEFSPGPAPSDFEVLETRTVAGDTWMRISIYTGNCLSNTHSVVASGWLPVHAETGRLNVWFYSRGC